jgi:membrane-bound lytic murein transglycosylase D
VHRLNRFQRWITAAACAPLVLLAGCPQQQATSPQLPANAGAPALAASSTAAAAPLTKTQAKDLATRAALDHELIARAEGNYRSGVDNYRSGRLEAARSDFDAAVDLILTSGVDVKSDPQLSDEFDQLLNKINTLEMSALKQGTGFSEPVEETPLESAADITFPANPDLVAKLKTELNTTSDLPLVINDQVAGYINVFSQSNSFRAHMAASLQRVGKYRGLIQNVLREEGVPQDLIYLAVAESGFQPQALNRKSGAGGMWQFMTFTGAQYGLTRNAYFDYRFDPEKSSRAYARYIKTLYNQFGDWYLAMAAYDWGPLYVQRAVQRTGYADFWQLYRHNAMPAETRAYVPQILAAVLMAKNPERYGLNKLEPSPPIIYDTISTDYTIDLRLVADVTDATVPEIVALNPALLRLTTPNNISFDLHIPPGTKELYTRRIAKIPEAKRASWRFHIVRPGESLDSVAGNFHDRVAEIASVNQLDPDASIKPGDELMIPESVVAAAPHSTHYTTRTGDTLITIADRFNISVEDLRRWNHLNSSTIKPHRTLEVTPPIHLAPTSSAHAKHSRVTATVIGNSHAKASSKSSSNTSSKKTSTSSKRHKRSE